MVAEFRSTSGLIKNMIINKFHTTYLMFYWNFLMQALLLTAINSQCSGADPTLIETGFYAEQIQDTISSFCKTIPLTLPKPSESTAPLTHIATFMKMEQYFGVRFGMKHFQVNTKYVAGQHSLALSATFYDKYEWKIVWINYLVSVDVDIFVGSHVVEEWSVAACGDDVLEQSAAVSVFVPGQENSQVVVWLRGLICHTMDCAVTGVDWQLQTNTLTISYNVTLVHDFNSPPYPMKAAFAYMIVNPAKYHLQYFTPAHSQTVKAGKAFNNYITDDQMDSIRTVVDDSTRILMGLSEIGSVVNWYSVVKLWERQYEAMDGMCQSLPECREHPQCEACGVNQVMTEAGCACREGYQLDEGGACHSAAVQEEGECEEWQYWNEGKCTECEANCGVCNNNGTCKQCLEGYFEFFFEGRLVCLSLS